MAGPPRAGAYWLSRTPGLNVTVRTLLRQVGDPGIEQQPGNRALPGRPDAPHGEAKAAGQIKVALIPPVQQFDEHDPLPFRQGHDGQVDTVALVTMDDLGTGITFLTLV